MATNRYVHTTGNRVYRALCAGTTSGTEPTHTSGVALDGTSSAGVYWEYIGDIATPTFTAGPNL